MTLLHNEIAYMQLQTEKRTKLNALLTLKLYE